MMDFSISLKSAAISIIAINLIKMRMLLQESTDINQSKSDFFKIANEFNDTDQSIPYYCPKLYLFNTDIWNN